MKNAIGVQCITLRCCILAKIATVYNFCYYRCEITQLPGPKVLGRTATFLTSFISSMYNWCILEIQMVPEFQSTSIVCPIHFMTRSPVPSYVTSPTGCSFTSPLYQSLQAKYHPVHSAIYQFKCRNSI